MKFSKLFLYFIFLNIILFYFSSKVFCFTQQELQYRDSFIKQHSIEEGIVYEFQRGTKLYNLKNKLILDFYMGKKYSISKNDIQYFAFSNKNKIKAFQCYFTSIMEAGKLFRKIFYEKINVPATVIELNEHIEWIEKTDQEFTIIKQNLLSNIMQQIQNMEKFHTNSILNDTNYLIKQEQFDLDNLIHPEIKIYEPTLKIDSVQLSEIKKLKQVSLKEIEDILEEIEELKIDLISTQKNIRHVNYNDPSLKQIEQKEFLPYDQITNLYKSIFLQHPLSILQPERYLLHITSNGKTKHMQYLDEWRQYKKFASNIAKEQITNIENLLSQPTTYFNVTSCLLSSGWDFFYNSGWGNIKEAFAPFLKYYKKVYPMKDIVMKIYSVLIKQREGIKDHPIFVCTILGSCF